MKKNKLGKPVYQGEGALRVRFHGFYEAGNQTSDVVPKFAVSLIESGENINHLKYVKRLDSSTYDIHIRGGNIVPPLEDGSRPVDVVTKSGISNSLEGLFLNGALPEVINLVRPNKDKWYWITHVKE
jgi:hypothetical protein